MVYIYVLKLQSNKYYVGKTDSPQFRLDTHFREGGSAWTKKYKPIQIHEIRPDQSDHDEQRITQEYMNKYGIDNVRGGPWCQIDISRSLSEINRILNSVSDQCYKCGSSDHFAQNCSTKSKVTAKNTGKVKAKVKVKTLKCERCGRNGHLESSCYAKSYGDGSLIIDEEYWLCQYCDREFDSYKGCTFHENVHCTKRKLNKKFNRAAFLINELDDSDDSDDSGYY